LQSLLIPALDLICFGLMANVATGLPNQKVGRLILLVAAPFP